MNLSDKKFFDESFIQTTRGFIDADWFNEHEPNYEQIVSFSKKMSLEMLKQRNELFTTEKKVKPNKEEFSIDIDEIIDIFNQVCFALPSVTKSTVEREKAIYKILETYTTQDIGTVFKNVAQSDYLCGKKVEWKADFDWIFAPKNFIKILEGKYKNIENGQNNNSKNYKASRGIQDKIAEKLFPI